MFSPKSTLRDLVEPDVRSVISLFAATGSAFARAFDFKGRTSRAEYWKFVLVNIIVTTALMIPMTIMDEDEETGSRASACCVGVGGLPQLAASVRRLHDTGRSGHWLWLTLVWMVGSFVLTIFYCGRGEPVHNAYGAPPTAGQQ